MGKGVQGRRDEEGEEEEWEEDQAILVQPWCVLPGIHPVGKRGEGRGEEEGEEEEGEEDEEGVDDAEDDEGVERRGRTRRMVLRLVEYQEAQT